MTPSGTYSARVATSNLLSHTEFSYQEDLIWFNSFLYLKPQLYASINDFQLQENNARENIAYTCMS